MFWFWTTPRCLQFAYLRCGLERQRSYHLYQYSCHQRGRLKRPPSSSTKRRSKNGSFVRCQTFVCGSFLINLRWGEVCSELQKPSNRLYYWEKTSVEVLFFFPLEHCWSCKYTMAPLVFVYNERFWTQQIRCVPIANIHKTCPFLLSAQSVLTSPSFNSLSLLPSHLHNGKPPWFAVF